MTDLPYANKSLGQHWLTDQASLEAIVDAADVEKDDKVLEIGPGLGTLTDVLVAQGAHVTALEYDAALAQNLRTKYKGMPAVDIVEGDVRKYDFAAMSGNYKIVANIPYYLTANLFRALIDTAHKPEIVALLVQKEVAERVTARPGKLSFLAVALQLHYEVSAGEIVLAQLFTPPPKVDSQVVIMRQREEPLFPGVDIADLLLLVKAGFSERRKKLKTSLKTGVGREVDTTSLLEHAGIPAAARAQELSLEQWHALYKTWRTSP